MSDLAAPKGHRAVMNRRLDPADGLDFFPTPPWATRALLHHVIPDASGSCWDGCAGEGHMAEVLREVFDAVHASDVQDYGCGYGVGSFAGRTDVPQPQALCPFTPDWLIMNPPFNAAVDFAFRALDVRRRGVAMLLRSNWAEGGERYNDLFRNCPPSTIAQFAERVPMVKDCWDPEASTATSYAWFVWDRACVPGTIFKWIPPGCRTRLTKPDDIVRFAAWTLEAPATPEELARACELIRDGAHRAALRAAFDVSGDRLTRICRDADKVLKAEKAKSAKTPVPA